MNKKAVDIVMVTYNRIDHTKRCIESLFERTTESFNLIVIDNGSSDGTVEYLKSLNKKKYFAKLFLLGRNMGIAVAANLGWSVSISNYYLKLDNDIEIINRDWLTKLIDISESNQDVGVIGYNFTSWHKTDPYRLPSGHIIQRFETCGGACTLIPQHVHEDLGYWNEDYGLYGFEDLEYGVRANLHGYITGYVDDSESVKHTGYDTGICLEHENIKNNSVKKIIPDGICIL